MLAITGPEAPPAVNCLLLGDSSADKTALLCAYLEQLFPGQPQPSFFFEHQVKTTFRGAPVTLKLWDLSGQECYDKLRQLAYKQIGFHVFLVCFSLVDPDSLENAKRLWVPELRWNCPNTPFLLVGTQADLRTDKKTYERLEAEGKSPVSRWMGQRLTKQLKAVAYVECSATRGEGLKELFEEQTLRAGLRTWQKRGGADGRRTNGREESCSLQ